MDRLPSVASSNRPVANWYLEKWGEGGGGRGG